MTSLKLIGALNRDQIVSETDSFTELRYQQFVRHFSANTRNVPLASDATRGEAAMELIRLLTSTERMSASTGDVARPVNFG